MSYFELDVSDISNLGDGELRELIGRLCEAEMISQGLPTSKVHWGGAQESADGGLDVSVLNLDELPFPNFVPRKNTGIQVKKHSMSEAKCSGEMLENGKVRPIIQELADKSGAYIIVSGKDDCSKTMLDKRVRGMSTAVSGIVNEKKLAIDFYGRDRIAAWMRLHPGVSLWAREKLGKPLSGWTPFGRWAATPEGISDTYLADEFPCVHFSSGTKSEALPLISGVEKTRNLVQPFGSATRITGLSGVGKTRFVQALFEGEVGENPLPASAAIYADLGEVLSPTATELVNFLIANEVAAILVLDNCPPDVHRLLQKKVSVAGTKLRLVTVEYDISDDKPEETEVVHIEPTSEETVSQLLRFRFPELSRVNSDKISEFSGGNARVALALASRVGPEETLSSFSDSNLFERLFSQRKGKDLDLLESAELLSLVYSFNVSSEEYGDELSAIGRIGSIARPKLHRANAELLRRQLAQKRGDWRAVLPHALSNKLARRAIENLSISDINSELFKPENIRLLKSCAHRVGYLHDFEPAQALAKSWMADGAPLEDLSKLDEQRVACLDYIAPVFPKVVLTALEEACKDDVFASRNNFRFSSFVRLLKQLAYDAALFEPALNLMLKFAYSEKMGENRYSIVSQMREIFYLYLSGTQAKPRQRQDYVRKLFFSKEKREQEIASELMSAALKASHWTATGPFDFGARKRDHGWRPTSREDVLSWYDGFLDIIESGLASKSEAYAGGARRLLARHFRGLWTSAGCQKRLQKMLGEYGAGGAWPDVWMAVKTTRFYDTKRLDEQASKDLADLEALLAPSDPYSEIEAFALTNSWKHTEFREGKHSEHQADIRRKVIELGKLAGIEREYLVRLGKRLWQDHVDSLVYFGEGIAEVCEDKEEAFLFLIELLKTTDVQSPRLSVLYGFLVATHSSDPSTFRKLVQLALRSEKLVDHYVYLLSAAPIDPWGSQQLINLAQSGSLPAWSYTQISMGRIHEAINDEDLAVLLTAILALENGVFAALDILGMRFHIDKDSEYYPSESVLSVGRKALKLLCEMHRNDIEKKGQFDLDTVTKFALKAGAPINEVNEIIKPLCDGIKTYRLYNFDFEELIVALANAFPIELLDAIFAGDDDELLADRMFKDRVSDDDRASLNCAPVSEIIAWCDGDQNRIEKAARAIDSFTTVEPGKSSLSNPKKVAISEHAMALLEIADDKEAVLKSIFAGAYPNGWSGSLADILETRANAIEELLDYPCATIRQLTSKNLEQLRQSVRRNREKEAQEQNRREQRFE